MTAWSRNRRRSVRGLARGGAILAGLAAARIAYASIPGAVGAV